MAKAMVRIREYLVTLKNGSRIVTNIHDEIIIEMPKGKTPKSNLPKIIECQRLMELSGADVNVPLRVSYSYHPINWMEEVPVEAL